MTLIGRKGGEGNRQGARGKVAQAVASVEAIEIKATVPEKPVDQALARFKLSTRNDEGLGALWGKKDV